MFLSHDKEITSEYDYSPLIQLAVEWLLKERGKGIPMNELYQVMEFAVWARESLNPM